MVKDLSCLQKNSQIRICKNQPQPQNIGLWYSPILERECCIIRHPDPFTDGNKLSVSFSHWFHDSSCFSMKYFISSYVAL